jgi:hypothetical protein
MIIECNVLRNGDEIEQAEKYGGDIKKEYEWSVLYFNSEDIKYAYESRLHYNNEKIYVINLSNEDFCIRFNYENTKMLEKRFS